MAEKKVDLEILLNRAKEQEKLYDWSGAAETYVKALQSVPNQDFFSAAEILERKAYSQYRASFQVNTNEAFREQLKKAATHYDRAKEFYSKAERAKTNAWSARCEAMISYVGFWRATSSKEKSRLVTDAWRLARTSLDSFRELKIGLEFEETYSNLVETAALAMDYEIDFNKRKKIVKEALDLGELAVKLLSGTGAHRELARSYVRTAFSAKAFHYFVEVEEAERFEERASECWLKAIGLSEEDTLVGVSLSTLLVGPPLPVDPKDVAATLEKALEYAKRTRDKFVIGCILDLLANIDGWNAVSADDSGERDRLLEKMLQDSIAATEAFSVCSFTSPNYSQSAWTAAPYLGYHYMLGVIETDAETQVPHARECLKELLKTKAILEHAGFPELVGLIQDSYVDVLTVLAKFETNLEKKREYLEDASEHARERLRIIEPLYPYSYWIKFGSLWGLAMIKSELAESAKDTEAKKKILQESIAACKEALDNAAKIPARDMKDPTRNAAVGFCYNSLGASLSRLCQLNGEMAHHFRSAEAFENSAGLFLKSGQPSRAAESYWKAARSYDSLSERTRSSEKFRLASDCYKKAMERIPQLAKFYLEHSSYMESWSEIEIAMYHHNKQESALSKEHFEKAAVLHESTGKWSFLSTNYFAWAQVENAEELSQKERFKESIDAFREAARLFKDSKSKMQEQLAKIEANDEKRMAERLIDAGDNRQELCKARIALEEARRLDKGGNLSSASEKYGLAADMFTKIRQGLTAEQDRKEIELIITLSKAWKAMAKAEAELSPELYEDAAHLFDEAKNLSPGDKAKNLAMGHSRLCMALGAGARYADNPESALHSAAVQNLESAAKYYLKADLQSAAEYAKASKLLFDSYAYMNRAGSEEDQERKTKLYTMAEKVLQASASSYEKADLPSKKEQVLKLLAKVQQDKELATSLTEILRAPDVVSTTMAFSSPTPTYETAVGLDRFAHADIQANLIAPKKELKMDEDLILGIELVNAGRGPAQLIKLQDLLPKGFTLREEPGGYRMEDSYLDLRGKRLDPLKTEEINLVLKPTHRGQFSLKPRILYLDESGKYKSHEPEPIKVSVGIEPTAPADKAVHADTREAAEARSLLAGLNVVTLSHYRIVGNYVRYGGAVCNALKDARQKIVAACQGSSPKRENYIIWAPPGSGKTYFVQEVAALLGDSVHYSELNLAKLDEAGFRSGLAELRDVQGPCICLVDEVDAKPNEPWPYEALMPFLDASATEGAQLVFVLAGSSGSSVEEMKRAMASRPKGSDILSRVPTDNEYSIPPMGVGDRLLVVLSQFRQAGKQMGHDVREVEKLGLYYVALNPRLSNARQLREFAVRCAERVLPSDDRLKYDSLFRPGDLENKLFWTQALQSAGALVGSFLLVED